MIKRTFKTPYGKVVQTFYDRKSPLMEFLDRHFFIHVRDCFRLQEKPYDCIVKLKNGNEKRYLCCSHGFPLTDGSHYKNNILHIFFFGITRERVTHKDDWEAVISTNCKLSLSLIVYFFKCSYEMIMKLVYWDMFFKVYRMLVIKPITAIYRQFLNRKRKSYYDRIFNRFPNIKHFYDNKVQDKKYFRHNFISLDWEPNEEGWKEIERFNEALK